MGRDAALSRNWSKDPADSHRKVRETAARLSDHVMLRDVVPGPITLLRTALANLTAEECGQEDRLRGLTAMGGGPLLDSKAHRAVQTRPHLPRSARSCR